MIVFAARVRLIQIGQFVEHNAPCFDLLYGVVDMRQFLAVLVVERNIGEIFSVWRLEAKRHRCKKHKFKLQIYFTTFYVNQAEIQLFLKLFFSLIPFKS